MTMLYQGGGNDDPLQVTVNREIDEDDESVGYRVSLPHQCDEFSVTSDDVWAYSGQSAGDAVASVAILVERLNAAAEAIEADILEMTERVGAVECSPDS